MSSRRVPPIRVAVCAADPATRKRLESMVGRIRGCELAASSDDLALPDPASAADLVLCEGAGDESSGFIERCAAAGVGLVLVGTHPDRSKIDTGVTGWTETPIGLIEVAVDVDGLASVLFAVASGFSAGSPELLAGYYGAREPHPEEGASVTPREIDVLSFVADGFSNADIAKYLEISENTVKYHLSRSMRSLGAANRTEAVLRAIRLGLLEA